MSKIIDKISTMKIRDTVGLWQNALRVLSDQDKSRLHAEARQVIEVINAEWVRRRRGPVDPDEIFDWPTTDAEPGAGGLNTEDWIKKGVFHFLGYRVGNTDGEPQRVREHILAHIFSGPIPPVFPTFYLDEWAHPNSAARLQKMAETIAALTRNARRRRDSVMNAAIRDWERDLDFLYWEYYVGKFQFAWPASTT